MDSFFSQHYTHQLQQQQQQQQQQQIQKEQIQQAPRQIQQIPATSSPRPLQGPRPTPLKISSYSRKINKRPPPAPPARAAPPHKPSQQQRQPVIIYAVSPKVIHTKPSEFMSLVQRLTGADSSSSSSPSAAAAAPFSPGFPSPGGAAVSPAAKYATIERAIHPPDQPRRGADETDIIDRYDVAGGGGGGGGMAFTQSAFPGILSPNPMSLPGISPNLFSTEANSMGLLHDMVTGFSPAMNGRSFVDNFFLSPTFGCTPTSNVSPAASWDLFNSFEL